MFSVLGGGVVFVVSCYFYFLVRAFLGRSLEIDGGGRRMRRRDLELG